MRLFHTNHIHNIMMLLFSASHVHCIPFHGPNKITLSVCLSVFAINFSVHLLACVSLERLLAVYWPHMFNLSATRANVALSVILAETFFCTTLLLVARVWNNQQLMGIFTPNNIILCVIVIMVCYTLIAAKLLRDANASRKKVAAQSSVMRNVAGSSTLVATAWSECNVIPGGSPALFPKLLTLCFLQKPADG